MSKPRGGGEGVAIYSKYLYGNDNETQVMTPSNWQNNCIQKINVQSTYFSLEVAIRSSMVNSLVHALVVRTFDSANHQIK